MNKLHYSFTLLMLFVLHIVGFSQEAEPATPDTTVVYKFDIKTEIGPAIWRETQKAFNEANEQQADVILIHMNTYGGMVDAADSIRTIILNSAIPVYVFIDNNAASAGALISIACDSIYMRPGANMGAATVVNQSGEQVPDKYQSYMRATMRATAEAHGTDTVVVNGKTEFRWKRDPAIAEAMVDPRMYVEGVSDSGMVLTFTANEAIKHGYCHGQAHSINEVLEHAGLNNTIIKEYKATKLEKFIGMLISPYLQGLLVMVIIGGIYFELQSPGIGFPLAASIIAAIVYFAPLYLEGLAENWEIILFIVGLLLVAIEMFVIPGFGVAGIAGIVAIVVGLSLSMVDNVIFDWDIEYSGAFLNSLTIVLISGILSIFISVFVGGKTLQSSAFSWLVLNKTQARAEGYLSVPIEQTNMAGEKGVTISVLRPTGKIEVNGELYDASAIVGFIEKNEPITVVKSEVGQLYVRKT